MLLTLTTTGPARLAPMRSALITGITGQDGLYLAELLLEKGYDVHGLIRGQNNPRRQLVERLVPDVRLHNGDLTDLSSLLRALHDSEPDEVYNLGAVSFVAYSWENAFITSDVTAMGVLTILEAVRLHSGDDPSAVRFYQALRKHIIDHGYDLAEPWQITEYGNPTYCNILDANGDKIVWTIERYHAKRIIAGMRLLAAAEAGEDLAAVAEQLER